MVTLAAGLMFLLTAIQNLQWAMFIGCLIVAWAVFETEETSEAQKQKIAALRKENEECLQKVIILGEENYQKLQALAEKQKKFLNNFSKSEGISKEQMEALKEAYREEADQPDKIKS